jgi:threonine/homoserine/homoserine lactone efflux protein
VFQVLLNGLISGLLLSFLIGPVFFVLIETSIIKGPKHAIFIDIGVLLSDILYLLAAYYFAQEILDKLNSQYFFVNYIAAGIFVIMGLVAIFKKSVPQKGKAVNISDIDKLLKLDDTKANNLIFKKRTMLALILKGIGLNVINPGVLVYWIAACTTATNELQIQGDKIFYYFAATLATMFSIDLVKIHFAGKLKDKMTPKIMDRISMIVGIIFIGFGVVFVVKSL